eukprot:TRINITY_DN4867_c0_g2_i1.p1 TRINITY_DN4867_c0_g2~~TRINITY_DN4867_c0_g2_i1.p1  ORF type:complete len:285 (-),score=54.14 TRINITY_DN4867_c0_g2_i1:153-1007(-)
MAMKLLVALLPAVWAERLNDEASDSAIDDKLKTPTLAFHVMGYNNTKPQPWVLPEDDLHIYAPEQTCRDCPKQSKKAPFSRMTASTGWWCAQRSYMDGLTALLRAHPSKDWYVLVDLDTVIFRTPLMTMIKVLNNTLAADEDVYMGHFIKLKGVGHFVMSGGGVLIRGTTLRKLAPHFHTCGLKQKADWCWHHSDWALGECFRSIGIKGRGHQAFQQFVDHCKSCCGRRSVGCHPVEPSQQDALLKKHQRELNLDRLSVAWAQPCEKYDGSDVNKPVCEGYEIM